MIIEGWPLGASIGDMMGDYLGPGIALILGAVSLAWYIGVVVLLVKIWAKVKHLPG